MRTGIFGRQATPNEALVPDTCSEICKSAYFQAQKTGKTPDLCNAGSDFKSYYDGCIECISKNASNKDTVTKNYLEPAFSPYTKYCTGNTQPAPPPAGTTSKPTPPPPPGAANTDSGNTITVTKSIPTATTLSLTATSTTTTNTGSNPSSHTADPSASEPTTVTSPVDQQPSQNKGWIAGPVIGGIILLAALIAIFFFLRKRRRRRRNPSSAHELDANMNSTNLNNNNKDDEFHILVDKPQLHGECLIPPQEMDAHAHVVHMYAPYPSYPLVPSEMMANEAVAAELPAGNSTHGNINVAEGEGVESVESPILYRY